MSGDDSGSCCNDPERFLSDYHLSDCEFRRDDAAIRTAIEETLQRTSIPGRSARVRIASIILKVVDFTKKNRDRHTLV